MMTIEVQTQTDVYVRLTAEDLVNPMAGVYEGGVLADRDAGQIQRDHQAELVDAQARADYYNKLETFPQLHGNTPEFVQSKDQDAGQRAVEIFKQKGMVVEVSDLESTDSSQMTHISPVEMALNTELKAEVRAEQEKMLRSMFETGDLQDDNDQTITTAEGLEAAIKTADKDIDAMEAFDKTELIQVVEGKEKKITIYSQKNHWELMAVVPRGLNKSDSTVIDQAKRAEFAQLPFAGTLWRETTLNRKKAGETNLQPTVLLGKYQQ